MGSGQKMDFEKTGDGFMVACPRCGRWHKFEWVSDTTLILDGDISDEFQVLSMGSKSVLNPEFVCCNPSCKAGSKRLVLDIKERGG